MWSLDRIHAVFLTSSAAKLDIVRWVLRRRLAKETTRRVVAACHVRSPPSIRVAPVVVRFKRHRSQKNSHADCRLPRVLKPPTPLSCHYFSYKKKMDQITNLRKRAPAPQTSLPVAREKTLQIHLASKRANQQKCTGATDT